MRHLWLPKPTKEVVAHTIIITIIWIYQNLRTKIMGFVLQFLVVSYSSESSSPLLVLRILVAPWTMMVTSNIHFEFVMGNGEIVPFIITD